MIYPFSEGLIGRAEGVLSWGPSSYGYDIRLGSEFKRPKDPWIALDPKTVTERQYKVFTKREPFDMAPGEFLLGCSVERFRIPRDMLVISTNKSTYARCSLNASLNTVMEPEWEGVLTIELANHGQNPVRIYPGEGIMQLIFLRGDDACLMSYADRRGKYMGQSGVTIPKV